MQWLEVTVMVDAEAAEAVAEVLRPYGHGGVVIEQIGGPIVPEAGSESWADVDGWEPGTPETAQYSVRVYLPGPGEAGGEATEQSRLKIEEACYHLNRLYPVSTPVFALVSDDDWATAWKKHYTIFRVGKRLVIRPAWLDYTAGAEDLVLTLDPGMAFGTGLHPSTQLCLLALEGVMRGGERVFDVGTGSGILAIAAARLGAASVLGVDIDGVAVAAAQQNVAANGLADSIQVTQGGWQVGDGTYEVVLVNILARIIEALLGEGLSRVVAPGGTLIAAGIIEEQAAGVEAALAAVGLQVVERRQIKDWVSLICRHSAPAAR